MHKSKEYKQALKNIKKKYKVDKYNRKYPNHDWKKNWKGVLKYNFDWSDSDIIQVLIYKLELTKAYLEFEGHEIDEDRLPKVKKLEEIITLGNKYLNYDYNAESSKFLKDHIRHKVIFYRNNPKEENKIGEYLTNTNMLIFEEDKDIDFINWLKNNNIDLDDKNIFKTYSGYWDDESNDAIWKNLVKKESEEEDNDLKTFFKEISEHIREWWD